TGGRVGWRHWNVVSSIVGCSAALLVRPASFSDAGKKSFPLQSEAAGGRFVVPRSPGRSGRDAGAASCAGCFAYGFRTGPSSGGGRPSPLHAPVRWSCWLKRLGGGCEFPLAVPEPLNEVSLSASRWRRLARSVLRRSGSVLLPLTIAACFR